MGMAAGTFLAARGRPPAARASSRPRLAGMQAGAGPAVRQGTRENLGSTLVWVERDGTAESLGTPPRFYLYPRLSPDGERVAVEIESPGTDGDIWLYEISRRTLTQFTLEARNVLPVWTPDGRRIVFQSSRAGPRNLFWKLADGSGAEERLTTSEFLHAPASWSPDGQWLAFNEVHPFTGRDIWVLPVSGARGGTRAPRPFLRTPFEEAAPMISPDGRWLAYVSDESGRLEVWVRPFSDPETPREDRWQISTEGGTEPMWARSGRELFYRHGDKMMAVDITAAQSLEEPNPPAFAFGQPRLLFQGRYEPTSATLPNYDVSPDGQRFLMLKPARRESVPPGVNLVRSLGTRIN